MVHGGRRLTAPHLWQRKAHRVMLLAVNRIVAIAGLEANNA